jgi:hypothetical protein
MVSVLGHPLGNGLMAWSQDPKQQEYPNWFVEYACEIGLENFTRAVLGEAEFTHDLNPK